MFFQKIFRIFLLSIFCAAGNLVAADEVKLTKLDDRVRVEIGGKLFTEYRFKNVPRPFCYPVIGANDVPLTRNWPMKETEGEEHDHPHHRGLWFTHGSVNGIDFWSEQNAFGKQVHEKFLTLKSGKTGVLQSANKWVAPDGKIICRDERTLKFSSDGNTRQLDFFITIHASEGAVVFGDTKEGSMGIRVAESMRLKPNKFNSGKPHGQITLSTGVRDAETWGKRAAWCDYSGVVDGKPAGIALFDHPQNLRHPTWWHVRDYGLFAANPFGIHDFEKKEKGAGDFTVPAGKNLTLRYRFIFHRTNDITLGELWETFAQEK